MTVAPSMQYLPIAHITGATARPVDVTAELPWLYVIVVPTHRIIYAGETTAGLVGRLASHFGSYAQSTLKQCAARHVGVKRLGGPYLVYAARLPQGDDPFPFDASSKKVRLRLEAYLLELLASRFLSAHPGWTVVSSGNPPVGIPLTETMRSAMEEVYITVQAGQRMYADLSMLTPWSIVLLDLKRDSTEPTPIDIGTLLEEVERSIFYWLMQVLKSVHGEKYWWSLGVPEQIRVQCATRREQEKGAETLPQEAYITLIDFRDIAKKNWNSCRAVMEEISGKQGKDDGTAWLVELNEARKLWAHPIKREFAPFSSGQIGQIRTLCSNIHRVLSAASAEFPKESSDQ